MDGEKSDVGIVVRKLAGKAAKASETARVAVASSDSKGKDLCEARNLTKARTIEGTPCARQKPGSQEVRRSGDRT